MTIVAGERLVFDHIHKTGGSAVSQALARALPPGTMSPHFNPHERPVPEADIPAWRHIAGHFGHAYRHLVPHFPTALTATVVRDPAAGVLSTYTYWRFNIDRSYAGHVTLAHDLDFSTFIRSHAEDPTFIERQITFLAGAPAGDPETFARAALAPYAIVGVTDDLPGFLERLLERIAPEAVPHAAEHLAAVESNASLGSVTPSPEDLAYLAENQRYERALYAEALRRAAEAHSTKQTTVPFTDHVSVESPTGGATPKTLTT